MPLKLTRKQGAETILTFPGDLKAVVRTDGVQQVVVSIDDGLVAEMTTCNALAVFPKLDGWPVCIIDFDGCNKWGQPVFAFDAPQEVKIHRDDIRVIK